MDVDGYGLMGPPPIGGTGEGVSTFELISIPIIRV